MTALEETKDESPIWYNIEKEYMRAVILKAFLTASAFFILTQLAFSEVVVGPAEKEADADTRDSNEITSPQSPKPRQNIDKVSLSFFARLGITLLPLPKVNPDEETAKTLVKSLIEQGILNEEEIFSSVAGAQEIAIDHVVIDLSRQRLFLVNPSEKILEEFPVSTGVRGYDTPPGEYRIVNKSPYAYSKKYQADMYHWMALTKNGDYGIHSLKSSGYERRLGRPASHGCIRLSRQNARLLFSILPVGMRVVIASRVENPQYFEPVTDEHLRKLVKDLLSAAPPQPYF